MKNTITIDDFWSEFSNKSEHAKLLMISAQETSNMMQKLIEKRLELNMTQRDLALKTGIKQPALARIETLKVIPKINTLFKIAKCLNMEIKTYDTRELEFLKNFVHLATATASFSLSYRREI